MGVNPHIDHVRVNTDNSTVKWKGSKIADGHEGLIKIQKGVLMIEHGKLVGGEFGIDMTSIINTDIESEKYKEMLEGHLKSDDFFNVEDFPTSTINITKVLPIETEDGNYLIMADLTIKGITHAITFQANVTIKGLHFSAIAKIKIDRTKWDIKYNSGNFFKDLGDKLILDEIVFDVFLVSEKS
jgi:polyisoprenoid-binding protein YceI